MGFTAKQVQNTFLFDIGGQSGAFDLFDIPDTAVAALVAAFEGIPGFNSITVTRTDRTDVVSTFDPTQTPAAWV